MKKQHFLPLIGLMLSLGSSAQTGSATSNPPAPSSGTAIARELPAIRISLPVKIDGVLNEPAWKQASPAFDYTEFRPKIGGKENYETRTEAFLMYDDDGFYFGGFCYERTKDSIARELTGRDGFGTNDYIGIIIDTYKDRLNGFEYFVTPLNEQWDAKMSPGNSDNGGEDFSWNAVWESGTKIHDNGWSFEVFIPYAAIRFGKKEVQDWGINITRRRRKTEQQVTWNPIDPTINGFLTQEGFWTGITNIKPPLRLQFSPYFSVYANHFPVNQQGQKNWTSKVNGGMDLKYGINQAFTLDATLIPDFGQVQSDNQVLNLTPFEVQFNEYRPFFTEGTELFGKGNLFYSRRIGGRPLHADDLWRHLSPTEQVINNPSESKLINATKISGRTQKGLGVGFLNAITKAQYATIEDVNTKERREIQTDPLTNFNLFVLDQTMKNNSSVSFINTNVMRSGKDYDANVSAALFDFNDKKNTWNVGGKLSLSQLAGYGAPGKVDAGYSQNLYFGKTSGRFNFQINQSFTDTKYTSNDLGYFTNNNFLDHYGYVSYRWIEPKGFYNRININFNFYLSHLFEQIGQIDKKYQRLNLNFNTNIQTKSLHWFGTYIGYSPKQYDFYEPRVAGAVFRRGSSLGIGTWLESNSAKKYFVELEAFTRTYFDFYKLFAIDFGFEQNYRFSSKFSIAHEINLEPRYNGVGFTAIDDATDEIIFARRRVNTIESVLGFKYSFTNRMGLTFRARHYFSSVENQEYFTLQNLTGELVKNTTFNEDRNQNANFFNIDMVYTWQFAPGSFLNIVWKDAAFNYTNLVERNYFKNLGRTIETDQNNNISLKVIYFLDYLSLKKKKKVG